MQRLDCDALALLVVRLESDQPTGDELCWHDWEKAPGAQQQGLPEGIGPNSGWTKPFKHLPGDDDASPYFNPHVERLLFPPGNKRGARRVCCPKDLHVDLGMETGALRQTRVDLLERVTTPLDPHSTFGLIHLSLLPAKESSAPDTLWWRKSIASTFGHDELSEFTLRHGDQSTALSIERPVRALAEALFGDPDRYLERSLYTVLMARYLPGPEDSYSQEEWRRALASPFGTQGDSGEEENPRETFRLARSTGPLLGKVAAFTLDKPIWDSYARNLRSYWAESIVFGLMQQDRLEEFQSRLADIDDIRGPAIEKLRDDWLEFRNAMWWSQLSSSSRIPQELLFGLRNELGTERLFTDLEGDMATYSDHRHRIVEDEQAAALANLQIYGSGLVVLGTLATVVALFGATGGLLAILIVAAVLIAIGISFYIQSQLDRE